MMHKKNKYFLTITTFQIQNIERESQTERNFMNEN